MSFTSLGLSAPLLAAVETEGYKKPYPIQEQAIPAILKNKDVLGIAQTGSGKTASFALPILMQLQQLNIQKSRAVHTLILVPTRELAEQIKDVFLQFSAQLPERIKTMAVYGGVAINPQMKAIYGTHVLVATPGRLLELVDSNAVQLSRVSTLVIDEADKMLNLGFKEEVNRILSLLPNKRQNLLFSATLNEAVSEIHQMVLHDPLVIKIAPKEVVVDQIKQTAYTVSEEKRGPLLRYLITSKKMEQVLVFTASTYKADNVANKLRKNGIDAQAIHGKKSQKARKTALRKFKSGDLQVLVTTDLLARGIDIEFLPFVINYELPRSPKDFVHRIGRTGRAEASGEALTFVTPDSAHHFKVIQKKMKKWVDTIDSDTLDLNN